MGAKPEKRKPIEAAFAAARGKQSVKGKRAARDRRKMIKEGILSRPGGFRIDVDREFPHLANAPIVEAVIHWQASPTKLVDREELKKELARRFGGYSLRVQQQLEAAWSLSAEGVGTSQQTRWGGFRLTGTEEKYVCRFLPNGILFSRLAPYEGWTRFAAEAMRFWSAYVELAAPVAIERMAARFISQMELKEGETAADYVKETAGLPESMGLLPDTFFRQDTMEVPGHAYRVRLVRAVQTREPPMIPRRSFIVDIDVFTNGPTGLEGAAIEQRLKELRFLKNLVFFNFMKDAERRFGGTS